MVWDDDPNWVHDMLGMGSFTTNQISSCNHRLVHLTSFNIFNLTTKKGDAAISNEMGLTSKD